MREEGTVELAGSSPRSTSARYRRARQEMLFLKDKPDGTPTGPRPEREFAGRASLTARPMMAGSQE